MRAASAIAVVDTPSSAARAESGRICTSGRSSEADEDTLPSPGSVRSSRSTFAAAAYSASASSPASTNCISSPGSLLMKLRRTPGRLASRLRTSASSVRWLRERVFDAPHSRVSTARRKSGRPLLLGSPRLGTEPIWVNTCLSSGIGCNRWRACSVMRWVSSMRTPGASSSDSMLRP